MTPEIAWLAGYVKPGKYQQGQKWLIESGLGVSGVGMDMIFHTLYSCVPLNSKQEKQWNQRYNTL